MKVKIAGLVIAGLLCASAAAQAQVSDDVVKIGVLTDHSGGFAYLTGKLSVAATQMAVDDFGGKVLGKPIQVLTADHQNKSDIAAAISRKWFDAEVLTRLPTSRARRLPWPLRRSRGHATRYS
jgi:branched-chain amino acid transport system substrate-binding protein